PGPVDVNSTDRFRRRNSFQRGKMTIRFDWIDDRRIKMPRGDKQLDCGLGLKFLASNEFFGDGGICAASQERVHELCMACFVWFSPQHSQIKSRYKSFRFVPIWERHCVFPHAPIERLVCHLANVPRTVTLDRSVFEQSRLEYRRGRRGSSQDR